MNRLPTASDRFPTVDVSADRLRRAGWSIGEVASGFGWRVFGTNGENVLNVTTSPQAGIIAAFTKGGRLR